MYAGVHLKQNCDSSDKVSQFGWVYKHLWFKEETYRKYNWMNLKSNLKKNLIIKNL